MYACITLIGNKADLYKVNADFSKLQRSIEEQKKINDDLKAEVEQLSRYDRIAKKAKEMGLEVNEDNVKRAKSVSGCEKRMDAKTPYE
ncbi:hypothetical protein GCM10020331_045460 [Ectobacillus funiculus]